MAFKLFVISSLLAYANAGFLSAPAAATYSAAADVSGAYIHHAPIAYAAPQVAIQSPAYGSTHQSLERSLGGAQSISHYSKAIDSAFSSVRKYDTRITNDALTYAAAPVLAKAVAPAVTYSAQPLLAKAVAPAVAYSTGPLLAKAVAPAVAYSAGPAPIAAYAAHAPVATYAAHAPVAAYAAPGSLIAKTVGAPVLAKAAVAYSPATVVAHTSFSGFGTAYEW